MVSKFTYLLFFLMEFLWRMFPLLRANRLYAIFNTGLKKWLLRVRDILFVFFYPEYLAFGSVRHEPCPTSDFLIIYFRWREGVPTSVLGSQSIIWLLPSSFPCQATWVRSPSKNIWFPLWPTFFLYGHSNTCTRLWQTESEQTIPVDPIQDVVRSSVKVPEFNKHLKKTGRHIGQNVEEITMKIIVRKPLKIIISKLCLRSSDNE